MAKSDAACVFALKAVKGFRVRIEALGARVQHNLLYKVGDAKIHTILNGSPSV